MEHNKTSNPAGQWLDRATEGIQFGPDRKAVRAELDGHLDDKFRIYSASSRTCPHGRPPRCPVRHGRPGGDREGAGQAPQALAGVPVAGQPDHPGVVLAVGVCQFGGWLWTQVTAPNVGGTQDSWAVEIPFSGGTVQAGQYTIQAEGTLCLLEQGDDLGTLEVTWRASSPRFWESPSYNEYCGPRMTREMSTSAGLRGG